MASTPAQRNDAFAAGNRGVMRYFFAHELPKAEAWLRVVAERDPVCLAMPVDGS